MNEQEKQQYLKEYKKAKEKGFPFFPDILFKDSIVILLVFLILVALAFFIGSPLEEPADPADASYTPRPEWYFLFLFQLLKYFPGELEVIGVVVLPTLAILLLFLLPFLDRSAKRYFKTRPLVIIVTAIMIFGVVFLTVQSVIEAPPPAEATEGDQTAALYAQNCAGCHGSEIDVSSGANLHDIITQGSHEGMPAWSADLTTDEVDALAGFILSPAGSELFTDNCAACHEAPELVSGDPLELKTALDEGPDYPSHADVDIPEWSELFTREERTSLMNFLLAPDGRRLFETNCASCHGHSVAFNGEEEELRTLISEGGLHLEMPPWREKLTLAELDLLAEYVVDPSQGGEALFEQHCVRCHGELIPAADDVDTAREIIATGGSHETMPVWGEQLTSEQLDALVAYTLESSRGTTTEIGQMLFADNCASCHGDLGEGGINPARPGDIIAPISTAEYLKTRDNATLEAVISQGQPNFGMSPFGSAFGGPLDDEQVSAVVAYIRSWQDDPPVELPPEVPANVVSLSGFEIFTDICAQCHGIDGRGDVGPSFRDENFRTANTNQDIFDTISEGHEASEMIAWGAVLSSEQIEDLVDYIVSLPIEASAVEEEETPEEEATEEPEEEDAETEAEEELPEEEVISFANDVFPILDARCIDCHPSDGGWDATTYDLLMSTGDNAPVVIPGDAEGSLLAQKLLGTHEDGDVMPPPPLRALNEDLIQIIIDWINAGAEDN